MDKSRKKSEDRLPKAERSITSTSNPSSLSSQTFTLLVKSKALTGISTIPRKFNSLFLEISSDASGKSYNPKLSKYKFLVKSIEVIGISPI